MNFQKMVVVEKSQNYLDFAFKKAREKSNKNLKGKWLDKIRKKESIKLDVVSEQLASKLEKITESYPDWKGLSFFYQELIKLTLDYKKLQQSLIDVDWTTAKIKQLHREYARKIGKADTAFQIKQFSQEYYGRVSSLLYQLEPSLLFLDQCRRTLKDYPDIKEMFTVCIFGFPNVGKTTLLNQLSGARGKVAAYSFTTQGINSGFFELEGKKIQVLDLPGTLARPDKMNNIEKIAYLAVNELAQVIIYVFDLSGQCGYSVKQQERLFQKLSQEKNILIYLSKKDLISPEVLSGFKYPHCSSEEIKKSLFDWLK